MTWYVIYKIWKAQSREFNAIYIRVSEINFRSSLFKRIIINQTFVDLKKLKICTMKNKNTYFIMSEIIIKSIKFSINFY